MLVLSRKRDEWIVIGNDIRICVIDIRGDKVRLGVEAPQAIGVHRQEVYDSIQRVGVVKQPKSEVKAESKEPRTAERLPGRRPMDRLVKERARKVGGSQGKDEG